MLAIRLQRTGRKGHAQFRMVVQESRLTPTSGRVVAQLGTYNPHTKSLTVDAKKTQFYLTNGAQPSDKVVRLLSSEKSVTLPSWVVASEAKNRTIRNPEKLRKNQPKEEAPIEEPEAAAEEAVAEDAPQEDAAQLEADAPKEDTAA